MSKLPRAQSLIAIAIAISALTRPVSAFDFLDTGDPPGSTKATQVPPRTTQVPARATVGPLTDTTVDRILVKKGERRLYLMRGDEALRSYKIALGYQPTGHKQRQGDGRTPEGVYFIDRRNDRSNYRKALQISYPNVQDRVRALHRGSEPGGLIMIHGQPNRRGENRAGDWTFGCIAVSDMAIDEIWSHTRVGTTVEIFP